MGHSIEAGQKWGTPREHPSFPIFLQYINELPPLLRLSTSLFADVKIWRTKSGEANNLDLQADLEESGRCTKVWAQKLSLGSVIMHIGHSNNYQYTTDRTSLPSMH